MDLFVNDLEVVARGLLKVGTRSHNLSDDPNQWQMEVLARFHQQVPYADQYDTTIDLQDIDVENRTGLGKVIVSTKVVSPREGIEETYNRGVTRGIRKVHVPVIIAQGKMAPLDVFIYNRKVYPLTERRLKRALFRPEIGDTMTEGWRDQGITRDLMPPSRMRAFQGLGGSTATKLSSVVIPTVDAVELKDWTAALNDSVSLKEAALGNPAILEFLATLAEVEGTKTASVGDVVDDVEPTAIQLRSNEDGTYAFKRAHRQYYRPSEIKLNRGRALELLGPEIVKAADIVGPQTVAGERAPTGIRPTKLGPIKKSGDHIVRTTDGQQLVGTVHTDIRDFDNQPKPIQIFVSFSEHHASVQPEIWGEPRDKNDEDDERFNIRRSYGSDEEPDGFGAFRVNGKLVGPCTIIGRLLTPEGLSYKVELFNVDGETVDVVRASHVRSPVKAMDGRYLLPRHAGWVPLKKLVGLVAGPMEAEKTAGDEKAYRTVDLVTSGNMCSLTGPTIEKLAYDERNDLTVDEAGFLVSILGYDQQRWQEKVAEARKGGGHAVLNWCLPITPYDVALAPSIEKVAELREEVAPLQQDLLKVAVFVTDPTAVDAMLSLKFLNPRNLAVFSEYNHVLDDAVQKLAELLVASRLGLKDIDENALVGGIKGVETTIEGLERLRHMES